MRWLILLLVVSCGKHQEPKALDLRDNDGDQIANAYESEVQKYIANVEPLGKINGTLQFQHFGQVEMNFANEFQTVAQAMVGPEQTKNNNYLMEGTKIRISGKLPSIEFKQDFYQVQVTFNEIKTSPKELLLVKGNKVLTLGNWTQTMNVKLMAGDLKSLLDGKAHLEVSKQFDRQPYFEKDQSKTVKDKTYRVFIDDGKKSEVLYVSKDLDINRLKEGLNIKNVREVVENDFFFYSLESDIVGWHQRNFANGDKALVYSNLDKLNQIFKERFQISKSTSTRENGYRKNEILLQNPNASTVYLIIRASKVMRTFKDGQISQAYSVGGGGRVEGGGVSYDYCTHHIRSYQDKTAEEASFEEIMGQLRFSFGDTGYNFTSADAIEESLDERGIFWKVKLDWPYDTMKIQLANSPESSFTTTGQFKVNCSFGSPRSYSKKPPVKTNMEAKFSLEVESYIEKIN